MEDATRARMWCFTLPANEEAGEHVKWPVCNSASPPIHWGDKRGFRYMKYQVERAPTTGKIHLQGYLCTTVPMRLGELKKNYSTRCHWEKSRGSIEQNDLYVTKPESKVCGPFELGTRPEGGASKTHARWSTVKELITAGQTRNDILKELPELAPQFRGIDALIEAFKPPVAVSREISVFYISGPTGVGKTHHALTQFPNACLVRGAYIPGKSFDQYSDEKELILDEWSPFEWPLTLMNALLDKWKCPLSCRYQNKYARWQTVIICTNVKLDECYSACLPLQQASFRRRVTFHMEMDERVEELDWHLDSVSTPLLPDRDEIPQTPPVIPDAPTPPIRIDLDDTQIL